MSVGYELVNLTRGEVISFAHLPVNSKPEIVGHPVSSAIVTWYLLQHQGDDIQFVSDSHEDWPFKTGARGDVGSFIERTDEVIEKLISIGILEDRGLSFQDEDDPDNIYMREIVNVWLRNQTEHL